MGDPSVLLGDEGARQGDEDRNAAVELAALRTLLVGPEQRHLASLQSRLDDSKGRAEDLAEVLPHVLLQHAQDPHFTRALTPPIEKAITASVHRNPKPLADALFPVMGPAIRKAVSAGLAGMVESLNRTLEHSLSWRSVRWRMEGWRTGRSFAEIVLLKTLVYRVEQVFLIDRRSGLLLQHVSAADVESQDADMVSGMLTAIKDFVQDSFRVRDGDGLEALKVGDLSVWIEPGPYAAVAAVIRGNAPREFRRTMEDAVETIHLQFGEALEAFSGDTAAFTDARSALEGCLETQFRASEQHPPTYGAWVVLAGIVLALGVWAGFWLRDERRWSHYLDRLRAEPGIVVVSTSRESGHHVVTGMRDPIATDPVRLIEGTGLAAGDVIGRWAPYHALDTPLVLSRAAAVLRPPAGSTLTLTGGTLAATGTPPSLAWVTEAARIAPLIPGVTQFDVASTLEPSIRAVRTAIEQRVLLFALGTTETVDEGGGLASLASDVRQLDALAAAADVRFDLNVVGHTDAEGVDAANLPLSAARAQVVADALRPDSLQRIRVSSRGVGSTEPVTTADGDAQNRLNRRVTIAVTRADR